MMNQQDLRAMTHNIPNRVKSVYDLFSHDSYHANDGFSKDFLWPVWCYTVHVRMPKPSKYNIVETAVGRMLVVKHGDVKAVADSLCLDADLVAFIAARLKDSMADFENRNDTAGFGDSGNNEDEQGCEEDDSSELQSLKFFKDASGGNEILPYVIPSSDMHLHKKEIKIERNGLIVYSLDNEDKNVKRLQTIPYVRSHSENSDNVKASVSGKFITVLERFLKKYHGKKAFSSLGFTESKIERLLKKELNVSVNDNPELAFFRVNISMELATFDFMVSDFTGTCYFRELSFVANKARAGHGENSLSVIMNKLFEDFYTDPVRNDKKKSMDIPPAVALFKGASAALKSIPREVNSDRDQELYRTTIDHFFSCCYSSLEHALYDVFRIYDDSSQIMQEVEQNRKSLIKTVLKRYQIKLCNETAEADISFIAGTSSFRVSSIHENHDMQTVLFLCISQAATQPDHPVVRLLQHHANFICNMRKLKNARDRVSHGSNDLHVDAAKLKTVLLIVSRYLGHLIINYKKYLSLDNDKKNYALPKEVLNGISEFADFERFKSRYDLEKMLGYSFISEIDPNLTSRLMILCQRINQVRNTGGKGTDVRIMYYQCIADMYRLLEVVFTDFVSDISNRYIRINDELLKSQVEKFIKSVTCNEKTLQEMARKQKHKENEENAATATDSQMCPFAFEANRSLATVNSTRVVNVLRGKGASLQASVVAYLFSRIPEQLQDLKMLMDQYDFDLVEYLEQLINLRGHGINTEIEMSNGELNTIFKKFIFVFKILLND